jgi:hypothetical protein
MILVDLMREGGWLAQDDVVRWMMDRMSSKAKISRTSSNTSMPPSRLSSRQATIHPTEKKLSAHMVGVRVFGLGLRV